MTANTGPRTMSQRTGIDWSEIHRRIAEAAAASESASAPSGASKIEVLKARARALAREPQQDEHLERSIEIIEFVLAYETYALDASYVREVHPLKDITALPGAPAFVAGIVNVRGQIVSVIDLKIFFDLPPKGLTDFNKVIIIRDQHMEFGLLVDAVIAVRRLLLDDIQSSMPTLKGARANYLQGVTAQRTIMLSAAKMLADPNLVCAN